MRLTDKAILLSLPLISISAEIIKSFHELSKVMAVRNYLCLTLVIIVLFRHFIKVLTFNTALVILSIYLIVELLVQDATIDSYTVWITVFESKLMLPLAFALLSEEKDMERVYTSIFFTGVLFAVFIVIFLVFKIGENQYGGTDGFTAGSFKFSRIYTGSFVLLSLPLIWMYSRKKFIRQLIPALVLITLAILVLSTRRTALIIVITGISVFTAYFFHRFSKILLALVGLALVLTVSFPLYESILFKQLEKRQHVFIEQKGFDLEQETRFEESLAVWRERIQNTNLTTTLFGARLFDSAGNYDEGIHGERPLHLDINLMLHGSGIVGLLLFILFYAEWFKTFLSVRTKILTDEDRVREATFVSVFLSLILLAFSGGMAAVTHNMIASLVAGSCLAGMAAAKNNRTTPNLSYRQNNFLFTLKKL